MDWGGVVMKTGGPAFAQPTAANKHAKAAAFMSNSNRSGAIPQTRGKSAGMPRTTAQWESS